MSFSKTYQNLLKNPPKENEFHQLDQRLHVLHRPDMYIGGKAKTEVKMPIMAKTGDRFIFQIEKISISQGLLNVIEEIIVNAIDQRTRFPQKVTRIDIAIGESGDIEVYNNGIGIPIDLVSDVDGTHMYRPQACFTRLRGGTNFADTGKRYTGGRNGIGAKATVICSERFEVITVVRSEDGTSGKMYRQIYGQNMEVIGEPVITETSEPDGTKIRFRPDYRYFETNPSSSDLMILKRLIAKRAYDIQAIYSETPLEVHLNGSNLRGLTMAQYCAMWAPDSNESVMVYRSENWTICIFQPANAKTRWSFVNGVNTYNGGTHLNYVQKFICDRIRKRLKIESLSDAQINGTYGLGVSCRVPDATYTSQFKDRLATKELPQLDATFGRYTGLKEMIDGIIGDRIRALVGKKMTSGMKGIRNTKRHSAANWAGSKRESQRVMTRLFVTEGESAAAPIRAALPELCKRQEVNSADLYGTFWLGGKLLNVRKSSAEMMQNNKILCQFISLLGLEFDMKYDTETVKKLNYGRVIILADQDLDGFHIMGLVMNLFECLWPELLELGYVLVMRTPCVRLIRGGKAQMDFFSAEEYTRWEADPANKLTSAGMKAKYYKGLGTSTSADFRQYFANIDNMVVRFRDYDREKVSSRFTVAFGKETSERKQIIKNYDPNEEISYGLSVPYTDIVDTYVSAYMIHAMARAIPRLMDGLKPVQRKVLAGLENLKIDSDTGIKTSIAASKISERMGYHHGDKSLCDTISMMAQQFCGANNYALVRGLAEFGSRVAGTSSFASPRYTFIAKSKLTGLIFRKEDHPILKYVREEGYEYEPIQYYPIVPTILLNGAQGIGSGYNTHVPKFRAEDLIAWIRAKIAGQDPKKLFPWYREFKGTVEIIESGIEDIDESGELVQSGQKLEGYLVRGKWIRNKRDIYIEEIPVGIWYSNYVRYLELLIDRKVITSISRVQAYDGSESFNVKLSLSYMKLLKEPIIDDNSEEVSEDNLEKEELESLKKELKITGNLERDLRLIRRVGTRNMNLISPSGEIVTYESPDAIMEDFFHTRRTAYVRRKEYYIRALEDQVQVAMTTYEFLEAASADPQFARMSEEQMIEFIEKKIHNPAKVNGSYSYLLNIPIVKLTPKNRDSAKTKMRNLMSELDEYRLKTPDQLWLAELAALESHL